MKKSKLLISLGRLFLIIYGTTNVMAQSLTQMKTEERRVREDRIQQQKQS
jgi:hypothetical protein